MSDILVSLPVSLQGVGEGIGRRQATAEEQQ